MLKGAMSHAGAEVEESRFGMIEVALGFKNASRKVFEFMVDLELSIEEVLERAEALGMKYAEENGLVLLKATIAHTAA